MKLTETFPARVTNNQDPNQRGRIKVVCVGLLGDEDSELPTWVEPVHVWGWFFVPDVGEQVEIEVTVSSEGDESFQQMSIDNLQPKWRGATYKTDDEVEGDNEARPVPDDFKQNYGKRRGFSTPGGHVLMFDDTDGNRKVTLTWTDGADDPKFSYMGLDENGSITIGNANGSMLFLNAKDGQMTLIDEHGNLVSSDSAGIKVINENGDLIDLNGGTIQILAADGCTISSKSANIDVGEVILGGLAAIDVAVLGNLMDAAFKAHFHPTGVGPSGPPDPASQILMTGSLSANVKVMP